MRPRWPESGLRPRRKSRAHPRPTQEGINKRIDDLRDSINRRFNNMRDLVKSEVKRIEERIDRLEHRIIR